MWSQSYPALWPHGLYSPWNSPGWNTEVGSLSLLQGIFPTQRLKPALPQCRQILYQVSHKGSARMLEWVAYPFSSRSSQPRNQTRVSCIHCIFINNLKLPGALVKVSIYHASIIILWHVGCVFIKVIYTYTFYSA